MKKTAQEPKVTENPLYHDTWMLLRKYRDVVWSLELSVQQVRRQFQIEYGSSIEEFLESLYVAGITFEGSAIEDHARCIERSYKMLKLLDTSVELLRTKHKYGENYYWLLYYTYLSPQQLANTQEIIDKLEPRGDTARVLEPHNVCMPCGVGIIEPRRLRGIVVLYLRAAGYGKLHRRRIREYARRLPLPPREKPVIGVV